MPQQAASPNKRVEFEGTVHEFPADATDAEIRQALDGYRPAVKTQAKTDSGEQPGFLERFRSSSGLPTSGAGVKTAAKMLISPFGPTARGVYKDAALEYGRGLSEASKAGTGEMVDAVRNIKQGGPVAANLGKAGYGLEHILASAFGPPGRAAESFGEDIHTGNLKGAAGTAAGFGSQALAGEMFGSEGESGAIKKLTYATDGDLNEMTRAFPEIKQTVKAAGRGPVNHQELQGAVDQSLTRVNNEFNTSFQQMREQHVDVASIKQDILSKIKPNMYRTAAGRKQIAELRRAASEYTSPWTMDELNQERMDAYQRLRAYRRAEASGQRAQYRLNPDVMVDEAVNEGAKRLIYDPMDRAFGKPSGYFSDLKGRQSALLSVKDDLEENATKVTNKAAKKAGAPFMERSGISTYAHPTGGGGISLHRVTDLFTDPESQVNKQIGSAFTSTKKAKINAGIRRAGQAGVYSYPVRTLGQAARDRERRGLPPLQDEPETEQP